MCSLNDGGRKHTNTAPCAWGPCAARPLRQLQLPQHMVSYPGCVSLESLSVLVILRAPQNHVCVQDYPAIIVPSFLPTLHTRTVDGLIQIAALPALARAAFQGMQCLTPLQSQAGAVVLGARENVLLWRAHQRRQV